MNMQTGTFMIAGAMSDIENYNHPAFNAMEAEIKQLFPECKVLNPASLPTDKEYEWYMDITLQWVEDCDFVVLLPGWDKSPGAQRERAKAVNIGRNVINPQKWNDIKNRELTKLTIINGGK